MMIKALTKGIAQIPPQLRVFIIRAIALFTLWMLVYELYLGPNRTLDSFFTYFVTNTSTLLLQHIYPNKHVFSNLIFGAPGISINGVTAITILDGCNGLELIVLYIGFILCLPSKVSTSLKFVVAGALGIIAINILRCTLLACLQTNNFTYTSSVHHYVFTIVVYSFIFYLWVLYLKYAFNNKKELV